MTTSKIFAPFITALIIFTVPKAFGASRINLNTDFEAKGTCESCLQEQVQNASGATRGLLQKINDYADIPRVAQSNTGLNYAFAPIGRIVTKEKVKYTDENKQVSNDISIGTAFMVSPCHVLTNRHVVFGDQTPALRHGWTTTFSVGNDGHGHPTHTVDAQPVVIPDDMEIGSDWTLLVLKDCIDDNKIGWMNISTSLKKDQKVVMAGFPGDRSTSLPTASKNCEVKDIGDSFFTHNCSSQVGNSGSPLFYTDSNGVPTVMGMHYASLHDTSKILPTFDPNHPNLGVGMDQINSKIADELKRGFAWYNDQTDGGSNPQIAMAQQFHRTQVAQNSRTNI